DCGAACLIADNFAVELIPTSITKPRPHAAMPLHEHCIFKNGIHLGELWYLTELARWLRAHRRNRFLLTAPPLRLPGTVGSPAATPSKRREERSSTFLRSLRDSAPRHRSPMPHPRRRSRP